MSDKRGMWRPGKLGDDGLAVIKLGQGWGMAVDIKDGLRKTWELETAAEGWRELDPWSVMCDGMQHSLFLCVQIPSPL